jgi:hypothetical protein
MPKAATKKKDAAVDKILRTKLVSKTSPKPGGFGGLTRSAEDFEDDRGHLR